MLALAIAEDMLIDHVDINRAFLQDDMLEEEGFEGDVYISPPPGYVEDAKYVYRLCAPLRGACTNSRAWHKNYVSFDGAARFQDSQLPKIHVVPPRCKRKDHGGQLH